MSSKSSIRIAHHCYKLGTLHGELPQVKTREGSHLLAKASDFGCKRTLRFPSCETARVLSRLGVGKKRDSRKVHGIELAIRSRGNIHSWKAIAWSLPGDFNPVGKPRARTHHNPSSRKFCEQGRNRSLIPFFFMQKRTPPGFPWLPLRSLHPSSSPSTGSPALDLPFVGVSYIKGLSSYCSVMAVVNRPILLGIERLGAGDLHRSQGRASRLNRKPDPEG